MTSWRGATGNLPSENGPRAKCDQVIFEAMAKAAEVVVGSRCWIDSGGSAAQSNGSSRFNLLVPEIQGVRSILQRWKRALHVPLRLDVYFQHSDQRRELLERWCLEYVPSHFQQQLDTLSSDPIVQLRYVCKKIVIWLRTLYCMCRMLPSQTLRGNTIGFSIYVVSEGNEDVNLLVNNQGFLSQKQPSSVMTPYGELGWKVYYANKEVVNRLLPEKSPYKTPNRPIPTPTMRIAVPDSASSTSSNHNQQRQQQLLQHQTQRPPHDQQQQHQSLAVQNEHDVAQRIVNSAPQHGRHMYHRSNSAAIAYDSPRTPLPPHRSNSLVNDKDQQQAASVAREGLLATKTQSKDDAAIGTSIPHKTLSGLSLAMMMSDENMDGDDDDEDDDGGGGGGTNGRIKSSAEQAEKRRAALHHAPPQLQTSTTVDSSSPSPGVQKNLLGAGEYGYAYNCQIPWQQTKSSNNANANANVNATVNANVNVNTSNHSRRRTSTSDNTDRAGSPSSFHVGTPPTGVLGATPPGEGFLGGAASPAINPGTLIPPRAGGPTSLAPPFVRPLGFVVEPASNGPLAAASTSASAATGTAAVAVAGAGGPASDQSAHDQHSVQTAPGQGKAPVLTSLDLLHSSPFQQHPGSSLISSLSINDQVNFHSILSSQFESSLHPYEDHYHPNRYEAEDDMPFAVLDDDDAHAHANAKNNSNSSSSHINNGNDTSSPYDSTTSLLSATAAVTTFAQRCATANRLTLFDTNDSDDKQKQNDMLEQLEEFKSFGASLMMSSSATTGNDN